MSKSKFCYLMLLAANLGFYVRGGKLLSLVAAVIMGICLLLSFKKR